MNKRYRGFTRRFFYSVPLICFLILKKFYLFLLCHVACGILVPQPGIEPGPQQWKHNVLTTGSPGDSQGRVYWYKHQGCSPMTQDLISWQRHLKPNASLGMTPWSSDKTTVYSNWVEDFWIASAEYWGRSQKAQRGRLTRMELWCKMRKSTDDCDVSGVMSIPLNTAMESDWCRTQSQNPITRVCFLQFP